MSLTGESEHWTAEQARAAGTRMGWELLGTCDSEVAAFERCDLPEGLQNDADFCAALDNVVMCCTACDWWVETPEVDVLGRCAECTEEIEE